MINLGVNIDHVATIRQARRAVEPDPVTAAALAELGGADGITVHLRQDRRHIQDRDVRLLRQTVQGVLNLEMAPNEDSASVFHLAVAVVPDQVCLVPEHRQELTTEGGLRVSTDDTRLRHVIDTLKARQVLVSLFIEPDPATVRMAKDVGADASCTPAPGPMPGPPVVAAPIIPVCAMNYRSLKRRQTRPPKLVSGCMLVTASTMPTWATSCTCRCYAS
jgi:hypothetical protein